MAEDPDAPPVAPEPAADRAAPSGPAAVAAAVGSAVTEVGSRAARVLAWADALQRRHAVFGFPYAVIKKYGDDAGGREAALITYYGFLSVFPLLLLVTATLSRVLVNDPGLRQQLIDEIVPPDLRPSVDQAVATLPQSGLPFLLGVLGLLFAGTGVVFSAYDTLNHLAGVPHRKRFGFIPRYARVLVVLGGLLAGALAVGATTVAVGVLVDVPQLVQIAVFVGSALIVFAVLLLAARLLIARPTPVAATWPAAALGAVVVTLLLTIGARVLPVFVAKAGPVYGAFATVVGLFSLLYLVSQALVYSAEVAVVRRARLWPRALDLANPTEADARALARLAREQERIPAMHVTSDVMPEPPPTAPPPTAPTGGYARSEGPKPGVTRQ